MRLGVVSTALGELSFEDGLAYLRELGVNAIEVACAGWQENLEYGDPVVLSRDKGARERWLEAFKRADLEISALSVHGQPLSPDKEIADRYDRQFRAACELAEQIGVERLTLLAGLPEGAPGDRTPCWIVNAFPPDNHDIYQWQWEERLIPYWVEHARVASDHGCRLCFEMHPCDMVYQPSALLRLREAVGPVVGCNFDPSHLFWQGIDPIAALRRLGAAVYHVHAKDTGTDRAVVAVDGYLDPKPFSMIGERAWTFRTVGYGHGESFWREFISALRMIGYDDVLSIEHEDEYLDLREGLEKAVRFLRPLMFDRPRGSAVWDFMQASRMPGNHEASRENPERMEDK